jgi:hypothetical protein
MSHLVKLIQLGAQRKEYEEFCVAHLTVQQLSRLIELIKLIRLGARKKKYQKCIQLTVGTEYHLFYRHIAGYSE